MMPDVDTDGERNSKLTPALVAMGMRALSQRTYAYIALGLTAGVFGYVIYDPNILRLVGAGMWGLFVLLSLRGGVK